MTTGGPGGGSGGAGGGKKRGPKDSPHDDGTDGDAPFPSSPNVARPSESRPGDSSQPGDSRAGAEDWPSESLLAAADAQSSNAQPAGVTVEKLCADPGLGFQPSILAGAAGLSRRILNARVQKSGLALVGHFHGLEAWRLQILGATEISFLDRLSSEARAKACLGFAKLRPCGVVLTRGVRPHHELVAACEATETPLLGSPLKSSTTINLLHALLDDRLAVRTRLHGVLVSIYGLGILIIGRSGVGKSECALDLVMRGHRLVADDVVECSVRPYGSSVDPAKKAVIGEPAELLEHHIEIRGLGILNLKDLFGVTSVTARMPIDLVVRMSDAVDAAGQPVEYDRLGLEERHHRILGVDIPEVTIPVKPGRDVGGIVQIAARNELLKRAGHHGARDFQERLERKLLGKAITDDDVDGGRG